MLNKTFFAKLRGSVLAYSDKRRDVIKDSIDGQNLAKKAIFAMHRDDHSAAKDCLAKSQDLLSGVAKRHGKIARLMHEGAYRAALEEYAEARLFAQFLYDGAVGDIKEIAVDEETYLGGLCDVPGEMLRYAVKSATERNFDMVTRCREAGQAIVGELIDMDLTGYLRNKFDQAKGAVRKLEEIQYEVSLKN